MDSSFSPNHIDDQAIHWAVELAYGTMTPEDHAAMQAWLAADPRHQGAFVRIRAWMQATDDAVVAAHVRPDSAAGAAAGAPAPSADRDDQRDADAVKRAWPGPAWRWASRAVGGAAALAACVAIMIVAGVPIMTPSNRAAPAGERIVRLKDGTIATLSADARIEIALSADYRRINLLSGEANFQVAKDKARPFVVRSGEVYAQATGTIYSVRRMGATSGTVKVSEGSVLVWPRDERDQAVLVRAGGSVTLDPGPLPPANPRMPPRPPRSPPPELAHISLDDVSVAAAVARFNRVNSTKIVLADPAIGEIRLIGLYRANDPEQFARTVAVIAGGRVQNEPGQLVITLK